MFYIPTRRMQEQSRRSGRHNSGDSDPLSTSSSLSIRFRRSSSGGSASSSGTSSPTDSAGVYIAGMLLCRLRKLRVCCCVGYVNCGLVAESFAHWGGLLKVA